MLSQRYRVFEVALPERRALCDVIGEGIARVISKHSSCSLLSLNSLALRREKIDRRNYHPKLVRKVLVSRSNQRCAPFRSPTCRRAIPTLRRGEDDDGHSSIDLAAASRESSNRASTR